MDTDARVRAWADQMGAHIEVTIEACQTFIDAWEDGEASAHDQMQASRRLVQAACLFNSMMLDAPWGGGVPGAD